MVGKLDDYMKKYEKKRCVMEPIDKVRTLFTKPKGEEGKIVSVLK